MEKFFNLEYLNTFVVAAETRKLNITSEIVYRSHSAVSTQIKKLEQQTGEQLFIRNKDMLTLTRSGEALLKYAKQILELNGAAFQALNHDRPMDTLVFGVPTDYAPLFLSGVYPALEERLPDVHVTVSCSRSRTIRRQMDEGKIDFAIVANEPQYPEDMLLWEEPLYWVGAENIALPESGPLPIALFSDDCIVNTYTLHCLKRTKAEHKIVFTSTMSENIENAVRRGVAISLLPASSITEGMRLLPEELLCCPFTLRVGCIWRNTIDLGTIRIVQDCLRAGLRQQQRWMNVPPPPMLQSSIQQPEL